MKFVQFHRIGQQHRGLLRTGSKVPHLEYRLEYLGSQTPTNMNKRRSFWVQWFSLVFVLFLGNHRGTVMPAPRSFLHTSSSRGCNVIKDWAGFSNAKWTPMQQTKATSSIDLLHMGWSGPDTAHGIGGIEDLKENSHTPNANPSL